MRCKETRDWILQKKPGEGPEAAPSPVAQHIAGCPDCHELSRASERVAAAAKNWVEETAPPWQKPHLGFARRQRPPLWYTWAPLAACMLLAALVLLRVEISRDGDGVHIRFGSSMEAERDTRAWRQSLEQAVFQAQNQSATQFREAFNQYRRDQEAYLKDVLVQMNDFNEAERAELAQLLMDEWQSRRAKDMILIESQMNTLLTRQNLHRENLYSLASYVNKNQN